MKEWILYCVLCSLIYAMSVQAKQVGQELTAEVVYWNKAKLPVLDCAIFIPPLDTTLGDGATAEVFDALRTKGYSPSGTFALQLQEMSQADSAGHKVTEYYTDRDFKKLNRNGAHTLYLTVTGIRSTLKKKHKFTVRIQTIGRTKEIAKTVRVGTLGQADINIKDLPNCQPRELH